MRMVTKYKLELIDADKWHKGGNPDSVVAIEKGTHEVELVKCPTGFDCNWFVLKGTKIGASEKSLLSYPNQLVKIYDNNGNLLKGEEC